MTDDNCAKKTHNLAMIKCEILPMQRKCDIRRNEIQNHQHRSQIFFRGGGGVVEHFSYRKSETKPDSKYSIKGEGSFYPHCSSWLRCYKLPKICIQHTSIFFLSLVLGKFQTCPGCFLFPNIQIGAYFPIYQTLKRFLVGTSTFWIWKN